MSSSCFHIQIVHAALPSDVCATNGKQNVAIFLPHSNLTPISAAGGGWWFGPEEG